MSDRIDHADEARKHIGWTRWWQEEQGITPETGVAMALLAQAEATLALIEQQRIANEQMAEVIAHVLGK